MSLEKNVFEHLSTFQYLKSKWLVCIESYQGEIEKVFVVLDNEAQEKLKKYLIIDWDPHVCVFNHCYLQPIANAFQKGRITETHITATPDDHYRLYTLMPEGKLKICRVTREEKETVHQPINLHISKHTHYINRVLKDGNNRYWPMAKKNNEKINDKIDKIL